MSKSPIVGIIQSRSLDEDKTIRKVLKRGLKSETNCLASSHNRRVSSIGDSIDFDHSIHRMISNDICVKYRSDNVNTINFFLQTTYNRIEESFPYFQKKEKSRKWFCLVEPKVLPLTDLLHQKKKNHLNN